MELQELKQHVGYWQQALDKAIAHVKRQRPGTVRYKSARAWEARCREQEATWYDRLHRALEAQYAA